MGVNNSLLEEIISESLSKEHFTVIKKLSKPKHDEDIAAELKLKATVVRTLLNDLHMKNLVEYERSKNKKTGWYTYLWKKRDDKIQEYVDSYISNKLKELNTLLELEKQGNIRFVCECDSGKRVPLEEAMETNFICPCCNTAYVESSSTEMIKKLESEIRRLKKKAK